MAKVVLVAVLATSLTGCMPSKEEPVDDSGFTWEEAKRTSQEVELEVAELIPPEVIVSVEQNPTGSLFACNETQHSWNGATTVTLAPGTEIESIVKAMEAHFLDDDRFEIRTRLNISDKYEVQLMSPETAENYIFGQGVSNTIRIDSGSACFTLPESVYPGGAF